MPQMRTSNGLEYLGLGQEPVLGPLAYSTRPTFIPTTPALEAPFSHPDIGQQPLANYDNPDSMLSRGSVDYARLAPPHNSLEISYGSSGQLHVPSTGVSGFIDLNMTSSIGQTQFEGGQEFKWLLKGPEDMSSLYEDKTCNEQTPRLPSTLATSTNSIQQSTDSDLDTLLAESKSTAADPDFEPANDTPQNTPKQAKVNKTSPTKAHGDSPKKATPKRRADKDNTEVASPHDRRLFLFISVLDACAYLKT